MPQYVVPLLHIGAVRGGSSGSPFFTNTQRLFANTSAALGQCVNIGPTFGKFRNAFAIRAFKEAFNPTFDIGANLWGIGARSFVCKDSLRLSGNYFRANQYQPFNQITLTTAQNIRAGRLDTDRDGQIASRAVTIGANAAIDIGGAATLSWTEERFLRVHTGASFTVTAGNNIELLPDFQVDTNAVFETFIAPCPAPLSSFKMSGDGVIPPPPPYDQVAKEDRAKTLNLTIPVKQYKPAPPVRLALVGNKNDKGTMPFQYAMPNEGKVVVYLLNSTGQKVKMLVAEEKHKKGIFRSSIAINNLKAGNYLLRYENSHEKDEKKLTIL